MAYSCLLQGRGQNILRNYNFFSKYSNLKFRKFILYGGKFIGKTCETFPTHFLLISTLHPPKITPLGGGNMKTTFRNSLSEILPDQISLAGNSDLNILACNLNQHQTFVIIYDVYKVLILGRFNQTVGVIMAGQHQIHTR